MAHKFQIITATAQRERRKRILEASSACKI